MWKVEEFPKQLLEYAKCPSVDTIIIIDNNYQNRPEVTHSKIHFACFGVNTFVNPAWNEGYWRSRSELICILNDDLIVDNKLFELVLERGVEKGEILGFDPSPTDSEFEVEFLTLDHNRPVGTQWYGFGSCMFMRRDTYKVIPELYQVWFGDDYLCHHAQSLSRFQTSLIAGEMSKTISGEGGNSVVSKRIEKDTENAWRYLFGEQK